VTPVTLAILLSFVGNSQENAVSHGTAVAERLVAAIKGGAEFQDADFEKRLGEADKAVLRRFATCKVTHIGYAMNFLPKRSDVLVRDFNHVAVGFGCKGVPRDTPVGISLYLRDGKIAKIETHNADLMRVE
jgi:hypothetical protein